mgnify:CR=1 FL=1
MKESSDFGRLPVAEPAPTSPPFAVLPAQGLNSDGTLQWADGVDAPKLFSTANDSIRIQALDQAEHRSLIIVAVELVDRIAIPDLTAQACTGIYVTERQFGYMETHPAKKMLFNDETVEYRNKPQLLYMNRLANNENYKLNMEMASKFK